MKAYRAQSWIDPRVEVRHSRLQGKGLFARETIKKGEVVVIWGGTLVTEAELGEGNVRPHSVAAVDEGLYLVGLAGEEESPDDFMNHACDPTVWMRDEVTLVARREIEPGQELTADYAMWEGDESWQAAWTCNCGSPLCRRVITGKDWRLPGLQRRYMGHFSPFIIRRIGEVEIGD